MRKPALESCGFSRLEDNRLDIKSRSIGELFTKYGTKDIYEKVSRSLAGD